MQRRGEGAESALRPLHAVEDARGALRAPAADPGARGTAILRLAAAVELSLRRLLRDDPTVPLELRLQALAPDELPTDRVVAELRRRDRISLEFAAAFHELGGVRRRVEEGAPPGEADAELALRVADHLEREAITPPPSAFPVDGETIHADEETLVHPVPPAGRGPRPEVLWGVLALLLLLLVAGGALVWRERRQEAELERGVALYRAGRSAEAVELFRRQAARDPDDPTPRLFLARIHRRAGRMDEAREELRRGLLAAPDDPALHRELGLLLLDAGRPDAAVARFRAALKLDPHSTEGYLGLVRALRAAGRPDAAERVLASAPAEVRALAGAAPASP